MFEIKRAVREATPALICLWGPSNSGKTYSALRLARGLVGPDGRIGLIDTENRRAKFYADLAGGWDHIDFQPPFTPDRYTAALKDFESAGGYGCVIIDSASHVWEGEGGVLDMADAGRTRDGRALTGLKRWQGPKMAHKSMVNTLLRAPLHVIFCLRAKDGVNQKGRGADAEIESLGLTPISEKRFIYEMTVSVLLGPDQRPLHQPIGQYRCNPLIPAIKAPGDLRDAIRPGEHLSEATGAAIRAWVDGGAAFDFDKAKLEQVAREIATMGTDRLQQHWEALSRPEQAALVPIKDELKHIAAQADRTDPGFDGPPAADNPLDDAPRPAGEPGDGEDAEPLDPRDPANVMAAG